jgi:hypothetical protein
MRSIGGVPVEDSGRRRLASQDVVFNILVQHDLAEGEEPPTAEAAADLTAGLMEEIAEVEPEAFTELVVAEMQSAAQEMVASGEVSEEVAEAAVAIEITVEEIVLEEPEIGAVADFDPEEPDAELIFEEVEEDDGLDDEDDAFNIIDSAAASAGAGRLGTIAAAATVVGVALW